MFRISKPPFCTTAVVQLEDQITENEPEEITHKVKPTSQLGSARLSCALMRPRGGCRDLTPDDGHSFRENGVPLDSPLDPGGKRHQSTPMRFLRWLIVLIFLPRIITAQEEPVSFNREIRGLLSNHCFTCHGPDEKSRKADLRLDLRETAIADVIVPGKPAESPLVTRLRTHDLEDLMPPPETKKPLTEPQIALLERWIAEGAPYEPHWAFLPIQREPPPQVKDSEWTRHQLDPFILRQLESERLSPSEEASRSTLARRLHLDLTGILPSPDAVDDFERDDHPNAEERYLDRLLAGPHYGERWGRHWLDQARYADSDGYAPDGARIMWPYRDWVIGALNADKPFDSFTIEQLAGDLLPKPTQAQLVATGFHRNTLINTEGGSDPEQFRNESAVDRTNTTGQVWLGLSVGCAQCHTHKYDPITHAEYFQMFAFFNSSEDRNSRNPQLRLAPKTALNKREQLDKRVKDRKEALKKNKNDKTLKADLKTAEQALRDWDKRYPQTMIMRELEKARPTHVHVRGDFLRKGDAVKPDVPACLPPLAKSDEQRNRLDLAEWLVRPEHPLTSRVLVNRLWIRFFGRGLVETENDFGMQGTPPTHPALLDWLASELIDKGWSLKALHRTILTSATYRQRSHHRADLMQADPRNRLLGRQARFRVEAEVVRDLTLSASGLLSKRIGGPSVYPPQPDGVYAFTQNKKSWKTAKGADRYRRGMYTFFYRSAPHPMLSTFDTPDFNTTCTQRERSNTPLQSLTLANDPAQMELVRALAKRLQRDVSLTESQRIEQCFRLCLCRPPSQAETDRLLQYFKTHDNTNDGWIAIARVVVNLDEFVTRD